MTVTVGQLVQCGFAGALWLGMGVFLAFAVRDLGLRGGFPLVLWVAATVGFAIEIASPGTIRAAMAHPVKLY